MTSILMNTCCGFEAQAPSAFQISAPYQGRSRNFCPTKTGSTYRHLMETGEQQYLYAVNAHHRRYSSMERTRYARGPACHQEIHRQAHKRQHFVYSSGLALTLLLATAWPLLLLLSTGLQLNEAISPSAFTGAVFRGIDPAL